MKKMKWQHLLTYLLMISLLVGCRTGFDTVQKPPDAITSTGENRPPVYTDSPEPVKASPSPQRVMPTSTTTPSVTPRPLETPTLTSEEVHERVVELMETNGGCQLPCWWGLQPGKTSWESAQRFLLTFNSDLYVAGDPNKSLIAEMFIFGNKPVRSRLSIRLIVQSHLVNLILVTEIDTFPSFQLASFLQEQGQPDEVWIHTLASNMGGPPPFNLLLYYKERGFFADFHGSAPGDSRYEGDWIYACVNQEPRLILSTPQPDISFPKFPGTVYDEWGDEWHPILPIETAMGISVQQFYDRYKPGEQNCFQLVRSLWPEP